MVWLFGWNGSSAVAPTLPASPNSGGPNSPTPSTETKVAHDRAGGTVRSYWKNANQSLSALCVMQLSDESGAISLSGPSDAARGVAGAAPAGTVPPSPTNATTSVATT